MLPNCKTKFPNLRYRTNTIELPSTNSMQKVMESLIQAKNKLSNWEIGTISCTKNTKNCISSLYSWNNIVETRAICMSMGLEWVLHGKGSGFSKLKSIIIVQTVTRICKIIFMAMARRKVKIGIKPIILMHSMRAASFLSWREWLMRKFNFWKSPLERVHQPLKEPFGCWKKWARWLNNYGKTIRLSEGKRNKQTNNVISLVWKSRRWSIRKHICSKNWRLWHRNSSI